MSTPMSSIRQPRVFGTTSSEPPAFPNSTSSTSISIGRYSPMAQAQTQNTGAWLTFTYASFAASVFMMGLGLWAMPADLWIKGYLMMASVYMLGSSFTLAKTVRDEHESKRFANRIEDAKAERLLMEVGRGA